ncbi:Uncharacterized conserved protein (COG2071) [Halomicrobium zhouii]|uniref:Uncharacterized conserved protein (COG2071) n=1 Tax=Halomicrobium zhouii TaxID=767519 RepID=A0A1I6KNU6_9EURY|nr:DUF2071 domain-containing protein [Halomicrobium zhouii]SFR92905.1 Uncharacterized conserved protein (COG2071) [Halomicrobium zhouii]
MFSLPVVRGVIDRRILVNFRVDPAELQAALPEPFRPMTVGGYGVGGICLIRLTDVRPRGFPAYVGTKSENAAHRIAVEWDDEDGETKTGVYVPRRDTSSALTTLFGGRVFSSEHHRATFTVDERDDRYEVTMESDDGAARVHVAGSVTDVLPGDSVFGSVDEASEFFQRGSLGYSPSAAEEEYDGIELATFEWSVTPMAVERVASRYFEDDGRFSGVEFDCALLMRDIDHEWRQREPICWPEPDGIEAAD